MHYMNMCVRAQLRRCVLPRSEASESSSVIDKYKNIKWQNTLRIALIAQTKDIRWATSGNTGGSNLTIAQ